METKTKIAFLLVLALAVWARTASLPGEALCTDELFTRQAGLEFFGSGLDAVRSDLVHPPVYYVLVHLFLRVFGDHALGLRLVSLLSGVACVAVTMFWTERKTGRPSAGMLAGALLAVSSPMIFYSQQARSYALYALLFFLVMAAADWALSFPGQRGRWLTLSLLIALFVFTHYIAVLYLAALGLGILLNGRTRIRLILKYFLSCLPAAVLIGAWMCFLWPSFQERGGLEGNLSWIETPLIHSLAYVFGTFNGAPPVNHGTVFSLLVLFGLTAAVVCQMFILRTDDRAGIDRPIKFCLAAAFFPPAALFLLARPPFSLPIWGLRHLLPSQAALVVFLVLGLWRFFGERKKILVPACALLIGLQAGGSAMWLNPPVRMPYDKVARVLEDGYPRSFEVLAAWDGIAGPVNYYLKERPSVQLIPENADGLPASFILLYRPAIEREMAFYERARDAGWEDMETKEFDASYGRKVLLKLMSNPRSGR